MLDFLDGARTAEIIKHEENIKEEESLTTERKENNINEQQRAYLVTISNWISSRDHDSVLRASTLLFPAVLVTEFRSWPNTAFVQMEHSKFIASLDKMKRTLTKSSDREWKGLENH